MKSVSRTQGLFLLLSAAIVATPLWCASISFGQETASLSAKEIADEAANPYTVIVEKNIFHLTNPPPPDNDKAKPDLPVVKITGFINIGSVSKVLFVSQTKDKKEDPVYYSLAEGESGHDSKGNAFELVRIREYGEAVDVINAGTPQTLTVKDDSLTPSGGAETKAPAGPEPMHNQPPPLPGRPVYDPQHKHHNDDDPNRPGRPPIIPPRMQRGQ